MSVYVLILTVIMTGSGVGGVTSIDVANKSSCHNIGLQWMKRVKEATGLPPKSKQFTYLCIKR